MKLTAKVHLVYPDHQEEVEVEYTPGFNPITNLNRIDKAVEKKFADDDKWTRWNLISLGE